MAAVRGTVGSGGGATLSAEQFTALMDASAVGMSVVSPGGAFLRVNPALCDLLGRSGEQLLATTWQELTHPDDLAEDEDLVADVLRGDRDTYRLTKRYLLPDGQVVWGDLSVSCQRHGDGRVEHLICQVIDVTEVERARLAAAESEERFRLLAENASDLVFRSDGDHRLVWVSPSVSSVLGWSVEEVLGTHLSDLMRPEHLAARAPDRLALDGTDEDPTPGQGYLLELRTTSGDYRWFSGRTRPVWDIHGRPAGAVTGLHEVTELVAARESALEREAQRQAMLDSLLDPHVLLSAVRDTHGRIVDFIYADANEAACQYNQLPREELVGSTVMGLLPAHATTGLLDMYSAVVETGEPLVLDDFVYPHEILAEPRRYDIRGVKVGDAVSFTWRDVTDRYQQLHDLAESEEKFRLLAENSTDAVVHARDGIMVWLSPSLTDMLGWDPQEWVGHRFEEFTHPEDVALARQQGAEVNAGSTRIVRLRLRDSRDCYHWVEIHASPFTGPGGTPDGVAASFRTIDAQIATEAKLKDRARYDELTGLLNRAEVFERLRTVLSQQPRTGHETAVAFCDLDGFKAINDTYGHLMGDRILKTLADDTRALLREDDLIGRIGGDEILLILTGVHDLDTAATVAEKVRRHAEHTHHYRAVAFTATLSIGVTLLRRGEEPDDIISRADQAMYAAKQAGGNRVIAA